MKRGWTATRSRIDPQNLYQDLETEGLAVGAGWEKQGKNPSLSSPGPHRLGSRTCWHRDRSKGGPRRPRRPGRRTPHSTRFRGTLCTKSARSPCSPDASRGTDSGSESESLGEGSAQQGRAFPQPGSGFSQENYWSGNNSPVDGPRVLGFPTVFRVLTNATKGQGAKARGKVGGEKNELCPTSLVGALFILKLRPRPGRTPTWLRRPAPAVSPALRPSSRANHGEDPRPLRHRPRRPGPAHASPGARDSSSEVASVPAHAAEASGARRRSVYQRWFG